jgi:hypothetical protein
MLLTSSNTTTTPGSSPNPPLTLSQQINPHQMIPNVHQIMSNGAQPPQTINPNVMHMMMMMNSSGGQPPQQIPINGKQQAYNPQNYNQQQQFHRSLTPNGQQVLTAPSNQMMLYCQQHYSRKKLSCYNCGSMNHPASECKEPTLESISQPSQFRLNFKVNNGVVANHVANNNNSHGNNKLSESDDMKKSVPSPKNNHMNYFTNSEESLSNNKSNKSNLTKNSVSPS